MDRVGGYGVTILAGIAADYEAVAFTAASAVGLTAAKMKPARATSGANTMPRSSAFISFETAGVNFRYRYDGTDPTASEGHLAGDGKEISLNGIENLKKLRFILVATGNATARVTYHV